MTRLTEDEIDSLDTCACRTTTARTCAPAPPTELWRVDFNVGGKPHHTWFDCEWHANQYADKITGALCWRVVER